MSRALSDKAYAKILFDVSYCAVMSRAPNPRLLVDVLVEVLPRYEYYSECPS